MFQINSKTKLDVSSARGRKSKSYRGTLQGLRIQQCLFVGAGWFLTSYMPIRECTTLSFEGLSYDFQLFVPLFRPTCDFVVALYVEELADVQSKVVLQSDAPDSFQYLFSGKSHSLTKMVPYYGKGQRADIIKCDEMALVYGINKYILPKFSFFRFKTHLCEVCKSNVNGRVTYGVLAYHKTQDWKRGNKLGGLRVYTQGTLSATYKRLR